MRIRDLSSDVFSSDLRRLFSAFDLFHKSTKIRRAQALIVHDDHRTILEVSHERSKRSFAIFRDIWGNHDETPDTIMFMLNFTHNVRQFLRQIAHTMRGEGASGTSRDNLSVPFVITTWHVDALGLGKDSSK